MIIDALEAVAKQNYSIKYDLTERLKECLVYELENKWELCFICYEIKEEKEWEKKGYQNLRQYLDYINSSGFSIKQKAFYDYASVWKLILDFDIKKDDFMESGFYKLRELVKFRDIVTRDEMFDLIAKLPYMSVRDLKKKRKAILKIEEDYNNTNYQYEYLSDSDIMEMTGQNIEVSNDSMEKKEDIKIYMFFPYKEEIDVVERALKIAEDLCEQKFHTAAFVFMCRKFVEFYERGLV